LWLHPPSLTLTLTSYTFWGSSPTLRNLLRRKLWVYTKKFLRAIDPWRWRHCIASKRQDQITHTDRASYPIWRESSGFNYWSDIAPTSGKRQAQITHQLAQQQLNVQNDRCITQSTDSLSCKSIARPSNFSFSI
jgi:hypothetical protein